MTNSQLSNEHSSFTFFFFVKLDKGFDIFVRLEFQSNQEIDIMNIFEKEFAHHPRRDVCPRSIIRVKPIDEETTSAEVTDEIIKKTGKKYRGPESALYTAIYPSVCITRVFGLAPYDFTDDQMVPSNICLLFSFAFMSIYCYIMYIVYLRFTTLKREKPVFGVVETTKVIILEKR